MIFLHLSVTTLGILPLESGGTVSFLETFLLWFHFLLINKELENSPHRFIPKQSFTMLSCGGSFICCHNKVIMLPQSYTFPRIIRDLRSAAFASYLQTCETTATQWLHCLSWSCASGVKYCFSWNNTVCLWVSLFSCGMLNFSIWLL